MEKIIMGEKNTNVKIERDNELIEMTKLIIKQNEMILKMNEAILKPILSPTIIIPEKSNESKK